VGIGERYGSRSSNQGTAYLLSSFASEEAAAGDGSSGVSVAPYVAAYSGGRGAPMPVYGLALSF
jgi:hypothetical protein